MKVDVAISLGIALWGASVATVLGLREIWKSMRRVEVRPLTYDFVENIGLADMGESTGVEQPLKQLAVGVINHSDYPVDVVFVGIWKRTRYPWRRKFTPLMCDDLRDQGGEGRPTEVKHSMDSDPELDREPARIGPHNYFNFRIKHREDWSKGVIDAKGVYIRLADAAVYVAPQCWRLLLSARARQAKRQFTAYRRYVAARMAELKRAKAEQRRKAKEQAARDQDNAASGNEKG